MTGQVRPATQAGAFYPADPEELRGEVERYIDAAATHDLAAKAVGFVSPHAGYTFSGATAGHVYRQLRAAPPRRVFVFAPKHRPAREPASVWDGTAYATPLGEYPVDQETVAALRDAIAGLGCEARAHKDEHSLEVQVPFLQVACPDAQLVPILVNDQGAGNIESLVKGVWAVCEGMERSDVAFVASSDAYHGYSLEACRASDSHLAELLEGADVDALYRDLYAEKAAACGGGPIAAVISLARRLGVERGTILHQSTSADAIPHRAGSYVVGYVAAMYC